jgi:O-antigen ligase
MAGSVFLVLKSVTWLETVEMGPSLRGATVVLGLLAFPLATLSLAPFWSAAAENVEQRANVVAEKDNQAATRFGLWGEAINKGTEAWMVGYGPGPHLTSKSYKRPPPDKFEAHNTALDIFTQGGIVALLAFILLCATTFVSVWRTKMAALAALIAGAAIFSMFHFIVRHPNFWFCIVLCLLQSQSAPRPWLKTGTVTAQ